MKRSIAGLVTVGLLVLSARVGSSAATIVVDPGGGGDFAEIQPAIDAAADGDTVLVKPGEYVIAEPIDFNRLRDPEDPESAPPKNLALRSEAGAEAGAEATTIRMSEASVDPDRASVLVFRNGEAASSLVEGFTLTGGRGRPGGGVHCEGSSPTLMSCTISGNSTGEQGGGLSSSSSRYPSRYASLSSATALSTVSYAASRMPRRVCRVARLHARARLISRETIARGPRHGRLPAVLRRPPRTACPCALGGLSRSLS